MNYHSIGGENEALGRVGLLESALNLIEQIHVAVTS